MNTLPRIGLMLGDMTGIGPEISAKILAARTFKPLARIAVIGDARVLELGAKDARVDLKWKSYPDVDAIDWSRDEVPLVDLGNIDPATIKRAEMSAVSGKLTGDTLKHMID
ncbi:MAG TPA: 4-hydroxythreonine-4-phosphate dehydrogenase, partial [Burkholderiales bacterium]|nr:4-hydroxythreonine-4-phosphate dehydrogenase [Burkholderiales bacterium]